MERTSIPVLWAVVLTAGCGAVDWKTTQLARVPADAQAVLQADLDTVIDRAELDHWLAVFDRLLGGSSNTGCLADLAAKSDYVTVAAVLPEGVTDADGSPVFQLGGEVVPADLAACAALLMPEAFDPTAVRTENGRTLFFGEGDTAVVADPLPEGGLMLGPAWAVDRLRAGDYAPLTGSAVYQRLRAAVGEGDAEGFSLTPLGMEGGPAVQAFGAALRRGDSDRYAVAVLAPSVDEAEMLANLGPPILVAALAAAQSQIGFGEGDSADEQEVQAEMERVLTAASLAIEASDVAVDDTLVRIALSLEPAVANPTKLMMLGAAAFLLLRSAPAVRPATPMPRFHDGEPGFAGDGGDEPYSIPGVDVDVDAGQPPVE